MPEVKIDGTVRTVEKTERRKKDTDIEIGHIVIMNEEGEKVDIKGATNILKGFNPEDNVVVLIKRSQQTIAEAVQEKREEGGEQK